MTYDVMTSFHVYSVELMQAGDKMMGMRLVYSPYMRDVCKCVLAMAELISIKKLIIDISSFFSVCMLMILLETYIYTSVYMNMILLYILYIYIEIKCMHTYICSKIYKHKEIQEVPEVSNELPKSRQTDSKHKVVKVNGCICHSLTSACRKKSKN